uniref:Uncharacterized protein n=2 Tax=Babesia bovis TaxID=5865 RepID=A7AWC3_BABBO|eukprot:XP_001608919.1 hypothetical protein [Babesia bovis T2Bo]
MHLYGSMNRLKGARRSHRRRPKKKTPAAIYPSPTPYYGNIQDYYGAPREYYTLPCDDALSVIRDEPIVRLSKMLKAGITADTLILEYEQDPSFHASLLSSLTRLRKIASEKNCDSTRDLVIFFERIIEKPAKHPHFIDRTYTLKRLQEFWKRREFVRYRGLFKRVFRRMLEIALKLQYAGVTLEDFRDPALWWKYGVFKGLPRSTMVDNYMLKHRIALESDIRDFYFIDAATKEVHCSLDPGADDCAKHPIETMDEHVIRRLSDDLKKLGLFPNDEWQTLNLSRVDELQRECSSADSQHAYAIRDFYLSHKYPEYRVVDDPYYLESFVNHRYRTKTLERDLGVKYDNWLRSGAPKPLPRPIGHKYQTLAKWKSLSRGTRRRLVDEYLYPRKVDQTTADPIT